MTLDVSSTVTPMSNAPEWIQLECPGNSSGSGREVARSLRPVILLMSAAVSREHALTVVPAASRAVDCALATELAAACNVASTTMNCAYLDMRSPLLRRVCCERISDRYGTSAAPSDLAPFAAGELVDVAASPT